MKIISRDGGDYYDYLIGKYGIDAKIVLDRTKFSNVKLPANGETFTIYFCDYMVEGMVHNDSAIYGEELLQFYKQSKYSFRNQNYYYLQTGGRVGTKILKQPLYLGDKSPNREFNVPILMDSRFGYGKKGLEKYETFPILKRFNFHKVFNAEEAYLKLYDWLVYEKPIEEIKDEYKIKGHGFDMKTSFRGK